MQNPTLSAAAWLELEAVVARFEEALHERRRPRIEDYLVPSKVDQVTLLLELIAAEAEYRWRHGETVDGTDYLPRFEQSLTSAVDRDRLADVLDAVRKSVPPSRPAKLVANVERLADPRVNNGSNHLGRFQILEQLSAPSGGPAKSPRKKAVRRADG